MRWPIELQHTIALTKRVTVHEKYANDMEHVASILSLTAYPGWRLLLLQTAAALLLLLHTAAAAAA